MFFEQIRYHSREIGIWKHLVYAICIRASILWLALIFCWNQNSLTPLRLRYRKRSRSRRLLGHKRPRDGFDLLPTFCERACGAWYLFWKIKLRRSKVRFASTFFFAKENHPSAPLYLLFRKKFRSAHLLACKCVRASLQSLTTFFGFYPRRRRSFLSCFLYWH